MKKKLKITGEMTVAEIMEKYPKTGPILMGYGFQCFGCPMARSETLEALAKSNQLNLDKLLEDLNKVAD